MVLFDLVGDCDLEIPREENSDPGLYGLFSDAAPGAAAATPRRSWATAPPILDDHIPFAQAGIPSVGLIDFAVRPGPRAGRLLAHAPGRPRPRLRAEASTPWGSRRSVALPRIR